MKADTLAEIDKKLCEATNIDDIIVKLKAYYSSFTNLNRLIDEEIDARPGTPPGSAVGNKKLIVGRHAQKLDQELRGQMLALNDRLNEPESKLHAR